MARGRLRHQLYRLQGATRNGAGTVARSAQSLRGTEDDGRLVASNRVCARLTPRGGRETIRKSRTKRMLIMRHHDRLSNQRRGNDAAPPRRYEHESLYDKLLGAPYERPGGAAFAFSIRGAARYLWCRLSPRSFTSRCNGPESRASKPRHLVPSRRLKFLQCALQRTACALPPLRRIYPGFLSPTSPQATLHDCATLWVANEHTAGCPGARDAREILKEPHPRAARIR